MDNRFFAIGLLAILLIVSGCVQTGNVTKATQNNTTDATTNSTDSGIVIRMTPNGFDPSNITIPVGTTVQFKNEDSVAHWPASAPHPQHTNYPEFDPKRGIAPGESWSFSFDKVGNWKFHDHLNCCSNPKLFGSVTVQ